MASGAKGIARRRHPRRLCVFYVLSDTLICLQDQINSDPTSVDKEAITMGKAVVTIAGPHWESLDALYVSSH